MPIAVARGPEFGRCNICGDYNKLTLDHTPPKGSVRASAVTIQHVASRLTADPAGRRAKSPDGVKFRSLCARCNNVLLGGNYDPELNSFTQDVARRLESSLILPAIAYFHGDASRIARSVCGHMMAQGLDRYEKGPDTEQWREFMLDGSLPFPAGKQLYYWTYPYQRQVLIRDVAYMSLSMDGNATAWVMKFYPLAFMVWSPEGNWRKRLDDMAPLLNVGGSVAQQIPLALRPTNPEHLMEVPTTDQAVLYGEEAIVVDRSPARGVIIRRGK